MDKVPPRIRRAIPPDLSAVRDLLVATWHDTYDALLGREEVTAITDRWHSLAALSLQVNAAGLVFLVAEDGEGEIVATALAGRSESDPACLDLRRLYVAPAAQGNGIGSALLAAIIDRFANARSMRLEVEPRNLGAVRFYRRHGFREMADASGDGRPEAMIMERRLKASSKPRR